MLRGSRTAFATVGAAGLAVLLWGGMLGGTSPASAQQAEIPDPSVQDAQRGDVIEALEIQGAERIDPQTIQSYMVVRPGDAFDAERIDRSLKSLFATGLFADVTLRRRGDVLVVNVVENPQINQVAFEGNKRTDNDELRRETQLRSRLVYTRTKVQEDVARILELYRRKGRFAATVEPKVIQRDQNRVDVVFEIDEGPSTTVSRISFVGNEAFSDSALREVLATKEEAWYRFFSTSDTYDPDRLTYDRELLRRHYLSEGYADFQVDSVVAELSPDRENFFITMSLSEGDRYRFGALGVEALLPDLDGEQLRQSLVVESGEWYDADAVEDTVQALTDQVGNQGYAFVDVRPRLQRDTEENTVDVTFEVQEGPRVFVERIDISGNVRTLDKVIRREFRLAEGDAFNAAKMRRSRQRIENLGFFERVEVTNRPSETAPDRTVVDVEVTEQSTGEVSFGVGWSSSAGPLLEAGVRERNLMGRGQTLRAKASVGDKRTRFDIGFTEPYFLDRELSLGFDLFATEQDMQDEASFDQETIAFIPRMGFSYNERVSQELRFQARQDEITDVASGASLAIRQQEGEATTIGVGQTITYDVRDSRVRPTEGFFASLSNDFNVLGGTESFVKTDVSGGQWFPVADRWILSVTGRTGYVVGVGEDLRITDRYFLGGDNLRGFEQAGAGPRDRVTDDALGGDWYAVASTELEFPIGFPDEYGVTGLVFTDVGASGEATDLPAGVIEDSEQSIRLSIGTGVRWDSPFGPLGIDLGFPILKEDFDNEEMLRVNFGARF